MMRRLYIRIYLAVLASIAMSVLLAGIAWHFVAEPQSFAPRMGFFVAAAESMLPPASAPSERQQEAIDRWTALSGFDIALTSSDGTLIANTGAIWDTQTKSLAPSGGFGRRSLTLSDGRRVFAQPPRSARGVLRGLGWLAALLAIAGAVALCAWPVVRRLTRNLEKLESSVAAFGAGDLSSRAHVQGKDEVGRLAETFNTSAERIGTLVQANRALLANASHELRSPLARLRMSVENVGADTPASVREEIKRNVSELDALVDEILTSSRLETKAGGGLTFEELDLRALAAEECARGGAELYAGPGSQKPIHGDARLLQRLMRNLIENANRYGGGTRVEVSIYEAGAGLNIDVCDRGPGVAEAERERIFEPFYRPAGASERAGAVGLGLSLVRQIALAHGGNATCLPRAGGGACFRVWTPL